MPDRSSLRASGGEPKCIPLKDIKNNLEVRRMSGRQLGQRKPVTRATLQRWRAAGFPKPVKKCAGDVELWDGRAVRAWLLEHKTND